MNQKALLLFVILLLPLSALSALNDAEFWNLGFSRDSRYVCFGQYWVDSDKLIANAEISVVDVVNNTFVHNGRARTQSSVPISAGSSGRNAVVDLVRETHAALERYAIEHANQGRIIYLSVSGAESNTVNFQDFQSNDRYFVQLVNQPGSSGASFHIKGTITRNNGAQESFSVGLPDYYRPNVVDYSIAQIILAPNNRNYIFVIKQSVRIDGAATVARYMIETFAVDRR